jgi:hypothetical protein
MRRSLCAVHLVPCDAGRRIAFAAFVTLALMGAAVNAFAQNSIQLRGLVDIVATDVGDYRWYNTLNTNDSNFDALRARLFVEGQRGQTSVYMQFLVSPEAYSTYRFFGGYIMHRVMEDRNVFIEAGLIPVHDGIWASQTYSNKNPLVGLPMNYYWKSTLASTMMPTDLDQMLAMRGRGQTRFTYSDSNGVRGKAYVTMPVLYDNCWNYGLYSLGSLGRFEFALGATLGSAGAPVQGSDTNDNIAWHAKVGFAFTPGLKAWVSGTRGAYLTRDVDPYMPAGKSINDYYQDVFGVSVDWKVWRLALTSETFYNHADTPVRADGLSSMSYWAQAAASVAAGLDVTLRYDALRYEEVESSTGESMTWDLNVDRWEGGVGYHVSRDLLLKGVIQMTRNAGSDFEMIPAVQSSFSF